MRAIETTLAIANHGAITVHAYDFPEGGYVAKAAGGQGVPTTQAEGRTVEAVLDALRRILEQD